MTALTVLVVGATGNQGGVVARKLLVDGHRVRALVRDVDSARAHQLARLGAALVVGELEDRDSLQRAAHGVDTVFTMSTPWEAGMAGEVRQGENVFTAVGAAAGVGHLVYSSVASADEHTGIPHFETKAALERQLPSLGVPYTVVAPVAFMENVISPRTLPGLQQGSLVVALPPDRPVQHVALADLGAFVAHVIEGRERFFGQRIEIAGDAMTGAQQAEVISRVSGKEIRYVELPIEQVRSSNEDAAAMTEWLGAVGYSVDLDALHRTYPGIPWRSFEQWAQGRDWDVLQMKAAG